MNNKDSLGSIVLRERDEGNALKAELEEFFCDRYGVFISRTTKRWNWVSSIQAPLTDDKFVQGGSGYGTFAEMVRWCLDNRQWLEEERFPSQTTGRGKHENISAE